MNYNKELQLMVDKLGPNGKVVYDEYVKRFPDTLDDKSVEPIVNENSMCIILGNKEPYLMKTGCDISDDQRDKLIYTIRHW